MASVRLFLIKFHHIFIFTYKGYHNLYHMVFKIEMKLQQNNKVFGSPIADHTILTLEYVMMIFEKSFETSTFSFQ